MPRLMIIRDLPGSGKSTLARELCAALDACHYEADMFFMNNGAYAYDVKRLSEAHAWCLNATRRSLEMEETVIVSNTFSRMREMEPYIALALELNVPVTVTECFGQWKSSHNVPEEKMQAMRDRWEKL